MYIKCLFFTDPKHNPFKLTNKTQKQALDYEENLCYCYDCDLEQSKGFPFLENLFHTPPRTPRISRLKSQIMKPTFLS